MSKKREYLSEILSKKSRLHKSNRWKLVATNISELKICAKILEIIIDDSEYLEKRHGIFSSEQLRGLDPFFPIKCVACVEGYFRLVCAHLIDFGDPFRNNAKQFSDIKFSTETVLSLDVGNVSAGDFISHLLPMNSFEHINSIMTTLVGDDFKGRLKEKYIKLRRLKPFFGTDEEHFNEEIKIVSEMFKLRHIYCHELGSPEKVITTPDRFVDAVLIFLHLSELTVEELTNNNEA